MKSLLNITVSLCLCALTGNALASGWTQTGSVTNVAVIRSDGLLIYGVFGNVNSCSNDAAIWIRSNHPQYEEIYGFAVTAMATGLRLSAHVSACQSNGWNSGTWNTVQSTDSMTLHPES